MAPLKDGDPINVIAGKYKGRKGIYKRPTGLMSVVVKLDGDNQAKTIRMRSIEKSSTTNADTITIDRAEYEQVNKEIADLSEAVRRLEIKIKAMGS